MTDASITPDSGVVLPPHQSYDAITRQIARIPTDYPLRWRWWAGLIASGLLVILMFVSIFWLFYRGVGVWGINIPVNWGIAISNDVWWIGIGHAGTFISAMLLLTNQGWRNSLNRFAEAMTLFAVTCAVMYPVLHLGRPFYFYYMVPYPASMGVWPQFRSPLEWDAFAYTTYLTLSVLFWYVGLIPDLATARDRARRRRWKMFFGIFALGWRGSTLHWLRWRRAYMILAGLAMPLVVSVHSGVSLLFAVGPIPGWDSTIFPPYFVLGAVFSGFAVVMMIAVTLRHAFRLDNLVTARHLDLLAQFLLATGLLTMSGYLFDAFTAWYSGNVYEYQTLMDRLTRGYSPAYWSAVVLNFVPLQALWFRGARRSPVFLFAVGLSVTIGMWFERYMLVVTGLYRDYLVSSWGPYHASFWEWSLFFGMVGLFVFLFFLFVRFLPMISISEDKEVLHRNREKVGSA